jgi:hypothetical protein
LVFSSSRPGLSVIPNLKTTDAESGESPRRGQRNRPERQPAGLARGLRSEGEASRIRLPNKTPKPRIKAQDFSLPRMRTRPAKLWFDAPGRNEDCSVCGVCAFEPQVRCGCFRFSAVIPAGVYRLLRQAVRSSVGQYLAYKSSQNTRYFTIFIGMLWYLADLLRTWKFQTERRACPRPYSILQVLYWVLHITYSTL